jgi:hypothetical protein
MIPQNLFAQNKISVQRDRSIEDLHVIVDNKPATGHTEDIVDKVVEIGPAKWLLAQLVSC